MLTSAKIGKQNGDTRTRKPESGYLNLSFNEFQTALSDMNMQNQFNKMSVFECQTNSENIHKL
jgi:hypothetical protein